MIAVSLRHHLITTAGLRFLYLDCYFGTMSVKGKWVLIYPSIYPNSWEVRLLVLLLAWGWRGLSVRHTHAEHVYIPPIASPNWQVRALLWRQHCNLWLRTQLLALSGLLIRTCLRTRWIPPATRLRPCLPSSCVWFLDLRLEPWATCWYRLPHAVRGLACTSYPLCVLTCRDTQSDSWLGLPCSQSSCP